MDISLSAEPLFTLFGVLPVTNTLLMAWITMALLALGAWRLSRSLKAVPDRAQGLAETAIDASMGLVTDVLGTKEKARKFFPLVATIFFFVLVSNWLGLIPGVGTVGIRHGAHLVPFLRSTYADVNMTLALALISVFVTQVAGIAALGALKYAAKFISFKSPMAFFVGILELVSEISKLISFSFRLYGNIFAGEVLLVVIAILIPYAAPLPFLAFEVFVGFIQAFVFAMLTLVFIQLATTEMNMEHKT